MKDTYISKVSIDLWNQEVTLSWTGSDAAIQMRGPFFCTPGKGLAGVDCDDAITSRKAGSNCTPKGSWVVLDRARRLEGFPEAEWATFFQSVARGIALHYYPTVPVYPASHGCVRLADYEVARLIYNNTRVGKTAVSIQGELRPPAGILALGSTGSAVVKLQRRLGESGYKVAIDGDYGSQTATAVRQFQRDQRLTNVDGTFGRITYAALFHNRTTNVRTVNA